MHLVCDFDNTLINTTQLWNAWVEFLERFGVDKKTAAETLRPIVVDGYSTRKHAYAAGLRDQELDRIVAEFDEHVQKVVSNLVFADVIPFLEKHKPSHKISLLTYADPSYQEKVIEASGIKSFFDLILMAGPKKWKVEFLREMLRSLPLPEGELEGEGAAVVPQIIFVDDSPNELEPVHRAGLPVKLFRIFRPEGKHSIEKHELDGVGWTCIKSIDEIEL